MPTPVPDLIYHAYRLAGVQLAPDRKASTPMEHDGLRAINRLLGAWNIQPEAISTRRIDLWPTAPGQQSYTYGPGGDWDAPRPAKVTDANFLFNTDPDIRRPLRIIDEEEWSDLRLQEVFTIPDRVYIDGSAPQRNVYFFPIPDVVYQIELYTWQSLAGRLLVDTDTVDFADGYEQALVYNLARSVMPMYRKRLNTPADDQLVISEAANSMARLARINAFIPRLQGDPAIAAKGSLYNWMTGGVD